MEKKLSRSILNVLKENNPLSTNPGASYCDFCGEELVYTGGMYSAGEEPPMWCDNPECPNYHVE